MTTSRSELLSVIIPSLDGRCVDVEFESVVSGPPVFRKSKIWLGVLVGCECVSVFEF